MGKQRSLFWFIFGIFKQKLQFWQQIKVENIHLVWPLDYESPALTTNGLGFLPVGIVS